MVVDFSGSLAKMFGVMCLKMRFFKVCASCTSYNFFLLLLTEKPKLNTKNT